MPKKFVVSIVLVVASLAVVLTGPIGARDITGTGMSQGDLVAFLGLLRERVDGPRVLTWQNCSKTAAASATITIGATFSYAIDGQVYYASAAAVASSAFGAIPQATGTNRLYVVGINSAGAFTTVAGTPVSHLQNPSWPATMTAGYCGFAGIRVDIGTGAPAGFILGSDSWNTASVTATVFNIFRAPVASLSLTDF